MDSFKKSLSNLPFQLKDMCESLHLVKSQLECEISTIKSQIWEIELVTTEGREICKTIESVINQTITSDTSKNIRGSGKKSAAGGNIYGSRRQVTGRKKENLSDSDSEKNGQDENKKSEDLILKKKEKPEAQLSKDNIFGEHSRAKPKIRNYSRASRISPPINAYRQMMGVSNSQDKPSQRKPFPTSPRLIGDPIVDDPYDEILRWSEEKCSQDDENPRKRRRQRGNRDLFR